VLARASLWAVAAALVAGGFGWLLGGPFGAAAAGGFGLLAGFTLSRPLLAGGHLPDPSPVGVVPGQQPALGEQDEPEEGEPHRRQ
jgi:hypothetical protein